MLKKIVGSTLVLVALSGCGHQQPWIAPAVVGGVIGYGMAQQRQTVIVEPAYCRQSYEQRVNGCAAKYQADPYYGRHHYSACVDQAKYQWDSCVGIRR